MAVASLTDRPTAWDRVLMWPVAFYWRVCGVFLLDMTYNRYSKWFSAVVFASGVLNFAITPWSVCMLDGWCDDALSTTYRRMYTRMVACTSLMSRAVVVYKARTRLDAYRRLDGAYNRNWPLPGPYRCRYLAYASVVVMAYVTLMLPINVMRLYLLYRYEEDGDGTLMLFFFNMYLQNWSICCLETHFELLCFGVYLQFRAINDELSAVRTDVMVSNRYPVALRSLRPSAWRRHGRRRRRACCSDDDDVEDDDERWATVVVAGKSTSDGVGKRRSTSATVTSVLQDPRGRPLETAVEVLRVRHGLTRESVERLNDVFGGQLALSLIALCGMVLFDIYNEAFHQNGTNSRSKFIYGWLLQYVFRFLVIVITAHSTTQEGYKTKVLVTEINNRHLNKNTKYELQLFLKQMNHQSIDITACDCITLNSRLVASAIAVGTTYLFVLIQFHSEVD